MSISDFLIRRVREFFLGDWWEYGLLRTVLFVEIPLLLLYGDLRWRMLGPFSLLYRQLMLIYFFGFLSAFAAAVAYVKDIYGLETDRMPLWHVASCFLGLGTPRIKITNKMQDSTAKEMVAEIGGPAVLNIASGYAVLTETLTSPAHIYGQGNRHFLARHERIYEVIDLHEQEGEAKEVKATTRDGISVIIEKLKFNYRLWDQQWDAHPTLQAKDLNPYPFSKDAIYNFVYRRSVQIDDFGNQKAFGWMGAVGGSVQGIIKGYVNEHRLDDVIAAREHIHDNPRAEIRGRAYEPTFKNNLRKMGTILRWWDPGEFKSLENIEDQFLSNWSVDIKSNVELNKAYGDAQKQAYEELGRAEAEAELLMSIIHSLNGIRFGPDKTQTLQNLILMRTAQVIRALNTSTPDSQSNDPNGDEAAGNSKDGKKPAQDKKAQNKG
jgi:hypothetical protein